MLLTAAAMMAQQGDCLPGDKCMLEIVWAAEAECHYERHILHPGQQKRARGHNDFGSHRRVVVNGRRSNEPEYGKQLLPRLRKPAFMEPSAVDYELGLAKLRRAAMVY